MLKAGAYILWILTGIAGLGWVLGLISEIASATGNPALAIWMADVAGRPVGQAILFLLFFGFALATTRLSPKLFRAHRIQDWIRGTPRTVFPALAFTAILLVARIAWIVTTNTAEPVTNILLIGFFAVSFTVLISGARIGLGTPTCENGHPIAFDMRQCSLCDAPAKNVIN